MVLLTVMIWLPLLLLSRIQLWYRPAVELLKWKIFNPHIHRLLISQWGRRSRCEQIFYEVFFEGRKKNTLTNKHLKKKKTKLMQLIKTFSTNKFSMWKTAIKNILSTQKVTFWCCFHKKKKQKKTVALNENVLLVIIRTDVCWCNSVKLTMIIIYGAF